MTNLGRDSGRRAWIRSFAVPLSAVMFLIALAMWALSSPTGSAPDEDYHLAKIYCAADAVECAPLGIRTYPCFAWNSYVNGDCTPADLILSSGSDKLVLTEPMGGLSVPATQGISTGRPVLYETVMSALVGDSLARTAIAVRLFNAALAVVFASLSLMLCAPRLRRAVVLGWLVAFVPLGMFMVASVSSNAWSIIAVSAIWAPLVSFLLQSPDPRGGGGSRRMQVQRAVFVVACALMALGARSEAPFLMTVVVIAMCGFVLARPRRIPPHMRWRLLLPLALILLPVIAAAAVSRDRLLGIDLVAAAAATGPFRSVIEVASALIGSVGGPVLGWADTPMPLLVSALASGALLGAVLIGLGVAYARKLLVLGLLIGLFAVLSLPGLWLLETFGAMNQPRYYLPMLCVIAGVALMPKIGDGPALPTRLQSAAMLASVAVANSLALLTNLERYVTALTQRGIDPGTLAATPDPGWWWHGLPFGPYAVWLIGTVCFAAGCTIVWVLIAAPATNEAATNEAATNEAAPDNPAPDNPAPDDPADGDSVVRLPTAPAATGRPA